MQIYRVHCAACGKVRIVARDITVTDTSYSFECPLCGTTVSKAATQRETDLLLGHGAARARDPRPVPPPLTMDDVITFHELLQDDRNIQVFLSLA